MVRSFAFALVVTLAGMGQIAWAQDAWETFSSKEGQFTVDLPGKPTINKTRAARGRIKTIMLGCKTEAGLYLCYKVILPTKIVKGTEENELDAERNDFAKEFKGKIVAERKIRAGEKIGRDFTVKGKDDDGADLNLRVREYLYDNCVFIIAVVSRPRRELPEDAGRFLGSLALGKGKERAQGTPTPDPKGVEIPGWGVAIDPYKDGEFVPEGEGKRLTVKLTGSEHQKPVPKQLLYIPRVVREVEGDFVITVKIVGEFKPGGKSTHPKNLPFNGAGILIWSDPENMIRIERAAVRRGPRISTYVNFEEFEGGSVAASHNEVMKGGDCWVRAERQGSRIQASISFDGKTWKNLKAIQTVYPEKLKIGLATSSSSGIPFTVTFEEFEVKGKVK